MMRLDVYLYHITDMRPIAAGLLWHRVLLCRASEYLNRFGLNSIVIEKRGSYLEKHSDRVSIQVGLPQLRENSEIRHIDLIYSRTTCIDLVWPSP